MALELIYTSAPRGLKPGTQGYCTVAATAGMSAAMMARLEALSGYRFAFPLNNSQAHLNPVNQSCATFILSGRDYVALSRICAAGFDHTQRSNLLAHHVVFHADEFTTQGPAWLASQTGFFQSSWTGEPRWIDTQKTIPAIPRPSHPAITWRTLSGDAGWAGILADFTLANPLAPAALVFNPGTEMLPLIDEALALITPGSRWSVTYSTYLTDLLAGTACAWRCLLPGAPMLAELRRNKQALVLDFTAPGRCDASMGGMPLGDLKACLANASERGAYLAECAETGANAWPEPPVQEEKIAASPSAATNEIDADGSNSSERKRSSSTSRFLGNRPKIETALSARRRMTERRRRTPIYFTILLLLVCLAIGYASYLLMLEIPPPKTDSVESKHFDVKSNVTQTSAVKTDAPNSPTPRDDFSEIPQIRVAPKKPNADPVSDDDPLGPKITIAKNETDLPNAAPEHDAKTPAEQYLLLKPKETIQFAQNVRTIKDNVANFRISVNDTNARLGRLFRIQTGDGQDGLTLRQAPDKKDILVLETLVNDRPTLERLTAPAQPLSVELEDGSIANMRLKLAPLKTMIKDYSEK